MRNGMTPTKPIQLADPLREFLGSFPHCSEHRQEKDSLVDIILFLRGGISVFPGFCQRKVAQLQKGGAWIASSVVFPCTLPPKTGNSG